jgi:AcrR family transcriptional regulator
MTEDDSSIMKPTSKPRLEPRRRDAVETRTRLLNAAGDAFARSGFKEASLRQICDAAGVNLGAVRYYFGSKKALYREVLIGSHVAILSTEKMPTLEAYPDAGEALAGWIEWFLGVILLRRAQHPYLGRVLVREIVQPTAVFDEMVRTLLAGIRRELERIVAALGAGLEPEALTEATNMTLMLCVQHEIGRWVLERFGYRLPGDRIAVRRLATVVTRYAAGGIHAMGGPR